MIKVKDKLLFLSLKGKEGAEKAPPRFLFPFFSRRRFDTTEEMDIALRSSGRKVWVFTGTGPKSSYKRS
jgi:hypothetical protein